MTSYPSRSRRRSVRSGASIERSTWVSAAEKIGFVPNVARLLAITPQHFVGWWSYFDDLMRGPSGLSKTQREMIAVLVSAEARCPTAPRPTRPPCGCEPRIRSSWTSWSRTTVSPSSNRADRAMLDFAAKLTDAPELSSERDLDELRRVGFTDEDILHIVELTAIFNYNVRLATGLGLVANREYHTLGRKLD